MSQLRGDLVDVFSGARLSIARRRRGLNKEKFARALGVAARSITNYESGSCPAPEILTKVCEVLDFPLAFFFGPSMEEIDGTAVSFRSLARMTAAQRECSLSQGALCIHLDGWFSERFNMPVVQLPRLSLESPEGAAAIIRSEWGLGDRPISNMIHLLESKGVRVYSLSVKAKEVDAFSLWKDSVPYVLLNVQKTAEHSRFDAAHELAHLVLHGHGSPTGKEAESEAHRFAAAFLMPESDVLANVPRNPGVRALIQLKRRWRVSLAALNYRLFTLGMSTEHHYKSVCIQISQMGRDREPEPLPREQSQLLAKILLMLAEDNVSRGDIADALSLSVAELDSMIFGLAITSLPGGRAGQPQMQGPRSRSRLTLVGSDAGGGPSPIGAGAK